MANFARIPPRRVGLLQRPVAPQLNMAFAVATNTNKSAAVLASISSSLLFRHTNMPVPL